MATKKPAANKAKEVNADKAAKKKARMEALKNRPAGQRPNSKQIDVIDLGNGQVIKNYGYAVKNKTGYVGIIITSVLFNGDKVVSNSTSFAEGNLTVKSKKGHGIISSPKSKKDKELDEEDLSEESED